MPLERSLPLLLLIASAAVVGTALASQVWGGLEPCELCLLQRWPYYVAIPLAAIGFVAGGRVAAFITVLLALVFLVSIGLASYHVGVEQHWFEGPTACTAGGALPGSREAFEQMLMARQAVQCDQPQWSFHGLTMAGLNLIASAALTALSLVAWRRLERVR